LKKIGSVMLLSSMLFVAAAGTAYAEDTQLDRAVEEVVGTPYKWGGTTIKGFDCSGFMQYIFDEYGIELSRTSRDQAKMGVEVAKADLRIGDLVFFNTDGKGISHAGIYLGDGEFAHSASKVGVSISKLSDSYYKNRYVTARRVVDEDTFLKMSDVQQ